MNTIWSSVYANQINGTDGSINYPNLNKSSTPYSYQPDACRFYFEFKNKKWNDIKLICI